MNAKDKDRQKQPWLKFYPADWRSDAALRMCSIGARGLWMEMLCIMHDAIPCGSLLINGCPVTPKEMAALAGAGTKETEAWLAELDRRGVFSRDDDGTIFSRRMRRDIEKADRDIDRGLKGGNPNLRRGTVPKGERARPFKRTDAPEKTKRIFARDGGKCHWCAVPLSWDYVEGESNYFHVDHVIAIRDGGTNDEGNLVAACAACNHDRARLTYPTATEVGVGNAVGNNSDHKAQKPEARSQSPEAEKKESSPPAQQPGPEAGGRAILSDEFIEKLRHAVEPEPVAFDQDLSPIAVALAKGSTEADVLEGIRIAFAKRTDPEPFRHWSAFAGWIDRVTAGRTTGRRKAEIVDAPVDDGPKIRLMNGRPFSVALIREAERTGRWFRATMGPKRGESGCLVPAWVFEEIAA